MSVVLAWLRVELRWRSLVVLALLIALAAGTVLTAVAGTRPVSARCSPASSSTPPRSRCAPGRIDMRDGRALEEAPVR